VLVHLLTNRIYLGEICHKGTAYPGEHEPIIDRDLWDTVQTKLSDHRRDRRSGAGASQPSLLIGMMVDGLGRPMTPSHASKGSTRYRYYISRQEPGDPCSTEKAWRIPASEIEPLVVRELCRFAETGLREAVIAAAPSAQQLQLFDQRAREFAKGLAGMPTAAQRERLQALRT